MIKNSFKIAWRNLLKNRLFGVLNILGLSVGLTVAFLLLLFIIQERSFNDVSNQNTTFRYLAHVNYDGTNRVWAGVPNAVGPTAKEALPEIVFSARTLLNDFGDNANVMVGQQAYIESKLYWADPDIIPIFDIKLLQGDPTTALKEPNTVLLADAKAKRYFGDENPIGKTIELNRSQTLTVTGVYEDLPATVTFDAELIGAYSGTGFNKRGNTWDNASFETWITLRDASDRDKVASYLPAMLEKHVPEDNRYFSLSLQSMGDVHLHSADVQSYSDRRGSADQLKQLGYLAAALLFMAAINYMNLATARAQQRSKEVGVSKTLGATRGGLIGKFYAETVVVTLLAIGISLVLTVLAIPLFNALSGKELIFQTLLHPLFLFGLPALWLGLTLVSGLYPATLLSGYSPIETLQKSASTRSAAPFFRKALVVVQFSAGIVLIVGVMVMHDQMDFISQRKLGYSPENVMAIGLGSAKNREEINALRNEIGALTQTKATVVTQAYPGKGESGRGLHKEGAGQADGIMLYSNRVIGDLDAVLHPELLAGRMIRDRNPGDTLVEVVLNKYAVDYLGLTPDEAIGRKVNADLGDKTYIVGVVDNFHYASLHSPVGAYAFTNAPESLRYLLVRFETGNLSETLRQYEAAYQKAVPASPFDYAFLDGQLESLYRSDRQAASVMQAFSGLAIFIGCLGLFGLAAFMAEKRTKEIGVRKVLGASVASLVRLMSAEFVTLVAVAFAIACPLAYWVFGKWLENFAYHIDISWWMFAVAGLMSVSIALLTVSWQAVRAALANPVRSLRSE